MSDLIQILDMYMPNGDRFYVNCRVIHRDGWQGTVTAITALPVRTGAVKLRVDPDDLDAARKSGYTWPLEGGGRYIQVRDTGLPANRFEKI